MILLEDIELIAFNWNTYSDGKKQKPVVVLCGNKLDEEPSRVVSTAEGQKVANEFNTLFMETSAKTGLNVNEVFIVALKSLPDLQDKELIN